MDGVVLTDWLPWLMLLASIAVVIGLAFQVRAILREVRAEGRETRAHLSAAAERVERMEHALLNAVAEQLSGHTRRAQEALKRVEGIPKPHRHQWKYNSTERTNKQIVKLHVCAVEGCLDVYREEEPEA